MWYNSLNMSDIPYNPGVEIGYCNEPAYTAGKEFMVRPAEMGMNALYTFMTLLKYRDNREEAALMAPYIVTTTMPRGNGLYKVNCQVDVDQIRWITPQPESYMLRKSGLLIPDEEHPIIEEGYFKRVRPQLNPRIVQSLRQSLPAVSHIAARRN
jgi:hypothetical protein